MEVYRPVPHRLSFARDIPLEVAVSTQAVGQTSTVINAPQRYVVHIQTPYRVPF